MRISVIMPVFNGEKYLDRSISSILSQCKGDIELVIVDDGSTDNSLSICCHLCESKPYVTIIHQDNKGVSAARNRGLEIAKGDYVCFVDCDDYVSENYFDTLLECFKRGDTIDWCLSGIYDVQDGKIVKKIQLLNRIWNLEECKDCESFFQLQLLTALFPKLYKRDIIETNEIRFNETISFAEDREFNLKYAFHVRSAVSIPYIGYFYRKDNQNSLSRKYYSYKLRFDCIHWKMLKENFERRGHASKQIDNLLYNELFHRINDNVNILSRQFSKNEIKKVVDSDDFTSYLQILRQHIFSINAPILRIIRLLYFPSTLFKRNI